MMYVLKMGSFSDKGRFYFFGRAFSYILVIGERVCVWGPNSEPGTTEDFHKKSIWHTVSVLGFGEDPHDTEEDEVPDPPSWSCAPSSFSDVIS